MSPAVVTDRSLEKVENWLLVTIVGLAALTVLGRPLCVGSIHSLLSESGLIDHVVVFVFRYLCDDYHPLLLNGSTGFLAIN